MHRVGNIAGREQDWSSSIHPFIRSFIHSNAISVRNAEHTEINTVHPHLCLPEDRHGSSGVV